MRTDNIITKQTSRTTTQQIVQTAWMLACNLTVQNELKAWHSSISLLLDCTLKHINNPNRITTNYPNYVDINVQCNNTKPPRDIAQLNFTTIRLLHETHDKTRYKRDKDATMNCSKTAAQVTNNQQCQRETTTTTTTTTSAMTTENTNTGSTQKRRHDLRQATPTHRNHSFMSLSQFHDSFAMRTREASCPRQTIRYNMFVQFRYIKPCRIKIA